MHWHVHPTDGMPVVPGKINAACQLQFLSQFSQVEPFQPTGQRQPQSFMYVPPEQRILVPISARNNVELFLTMMASRRSLASNHEISYTNHQSICLDSKSIHSTAQASFDGEGSTSNRDHRRPTRCTIAHTLLEHTGTAMEK